VTINQQISVLNKNTLASSPERAILLTPQNNDASRAADCDSLIRVTLGSARRQPNSELTKLSVGHLSERQCDV